MWPMHPMEMMAMMGTKPILIEFTDGSNPDEDVKSLLDCRNLQRVSPRADGTTLHIGGEEYPVKENYVEVQKLLVRNYLLERVEQPQFQTEDPVEIYYVPRNHKELEEGTRGTVVSRVFDKVYEVDFGEGHGIIAVSAENLRAAKKEEKVEEPALQT